MVFESNAPPCWRLHIALAGNRECPARTLLATHAASGLLVLTVLSGVLSPHLHLSLQVMRP